jgi:acylphosphatase
VGVLGGGGGGPPRNRPDGTVEVYAHGSATQLRRLHEWLQQGPPAARVTEVEADWGETEDALSPRFEVTA